MGRRVRTLLIDNYDSFTFNLFQLLAEVNGEEPLVVRNDGETWDELASWGADNIVISPGPGTPEHPADIGVCADAIRHATVPLLGVCLGHQALAHLAGGVVAPAPEALHGRLSAVYHDASGLFAGLPQGFEVVRYHSLCVERPVPPLLGVTAWTAEDVVMGLCHRTRPQWGVQFHPESVSTAHGAALLATFRDITVALRGERRGGGRRGRTVVPRPRGGARTDRPIKDEPRHLLLHRRVTPAPDPERAFVHLFGTDPAAWWLDSSREGHDPPTFSYMGGAGGALAARVTYDVGTRRVTVERASGTETVEGTCILDHLRDELERLGRSVDRGGTPETIGLDCGFVGFLGYEVKADTGGALAHRATTPDAFFHLADRVLAFEHDTGAVHLLALVERDDERRGRAWLDAIERDLASLPPLEPPALPVEPTPAPFTPVTSREDYLADVRRCRRYLLEGESYEICLTNRLDLEVTPDPVVLHRVLRRLNPAPHAALLRFAPGWVVSSSPERFLRIGRDRRVESKPIKGTAPRSPSREDDVAIRDALRSDEKSRAENLMITDLLRNDLGLVCEIGSVHVPSLFAVESYETVHQLVSTVRGRLREGLSAVDCVRACFPGGSMTGAPKRRTMEILDELEPVARGVYSGALGYLGLGGAADLSIVIRTVVHDGARTTIGVGGAIVVQSDPVAELEETMLKAQVLLQACGAAAGTPPTTDGRRPPHGR